MEEGGRRRRIMDEDNISALVQVCRERESEAQKVEQC